ncbi:hypothetical protein RA280_37590 [Cupriavidus sp. CV2]|uniref:hypothetical protein n=1 Tax=Cupriavidus ulmosensis TaxID=3065913 RepID=UPI00296B4B1D|nr:hypothetical protein [Cupriavidus sp. CV2]MDW3687349.1 hypothetical protein [Cupriavidus sp. CV2]
MAVISVSIGSVRQGRFSEKPARWNRPSEEARITNAGCGKAFATGFANLDSAAQS